MTDTIYVVSEHGVEHSTVMGVFDRESRARDYCSYLNETLGVKDRWTGNSYDYHPHIMNPRWSRNDNHHFWLMGHADDMDSISETTFTSVEIEDQRDESQSVYVSRYGTTNVCVQARVDAVDHEDAKRKAVRMLVGIYFTDDEDDSIYVSYSDDLSEFSIERD